MSKQIEYKGHILFLENSDRPDFFFVSIYKKYKAEQQDYTEEYKDSEKCFSDAKKLIDSWEK